MCRLWETSEHSALNWMSSSKFSLQAWLMDLWGRGDRKHVRACGWHQGNGIFQTQQDWYTWTPRGWDRAHRSCTGPNQPEISALGRGSGHKVPPLTEKLLSADTCWEREIRFLQWNVTGHIYCTPGYTPHPGAVSQHETDTMWFLWAFCFTFLFGNPLSFLFLCVCFEFCFVFKRERQTY